MNAAKRSVHHPTDVVNVTYRRGECNARVIRELCSRGGGSFEIDVTLASCIGSCDLLC